MISPINMAQSVLGLRDLHGSWTQTSGAKTSFARLCAWSNTHSFVTSTRWFFAVFFPRNLFFKTMQVQSDDARKRYFFHLNEKNFQFFLRISGRFNFDNLLKTTNLWMPCATKAKMQVFVFNWNIYLFPLFSQLHLRKNYWKSFWRRNGANMDWMPQKQSREFPKEMTKSIFFCSGSISLQIYHQVGGNDNKAQFESTPPENEPRFASQCRI